MSRTPEDLGPPSEMGRLLVEQVAAGRMSRRDILRRGTVLGFGIGSLGTLLAACGDDSSAPAAATATPKKGGTLVAGIVRPSGSVDPLTSLSKSGGYVQRPALVAMARIHQDGTLSPELATSWSPNADATAWTFKLRTGSWTSGQPFTAGDIAATLDVLLNPAKPAPSVSGYQGILSHGNYQVVDDRTITFHLDRPYVDFPYVVAYGPSLWVPKGYQEGQYEAGKVGGMGPFLLQSYSVDRGARYVRNPKYWDAANIHLDALEYKFYDDEQAMALALQGGEVDMLPILSSSAVTALEGVDTVDILAASSSAYNSLRMHVDTAPFTDRRVRQALAYAIDRKAIVDTIYGGAADLGNDHAFAPAFPQSAEVTKRVPQRARDVAKAKSLLAEAGHPTGLKLTVTSEQYADIPQYLQLVQSQVRAAGIELQLKMISQADYYGTAGNEPWLDVPFGATDWGERATPSGVITPAYLTGAAFNESHYANPAFDAAVKAYDAELDETKRANLAVQAATIQHDDTPAIIAYFAKTRRLVSKRVHGVPAGPGSGVDLAGVWKE